MATNTISKQERRVSLPYYHDPCLIYLRLRSLGHAVLLDSGDGSPNSRFDVIAAQPETARSLVVDANSTMEVFAEALNNWKAQVETRPNPAQASQDIPFYGGYIGHLAYEAGRRLHKLPAITTGTLPIAVAHYYPWAVVQDRQKQQSWLVGDSDAVDAISSVVLSMLATDAAEPPGGDFFLTQRFQARWSLEEYRGRFARVKDYITSGDCYQINIGQPFSGTFTGDLFAAYRRLRGVANAPFGGFFPLNADQSLLCLSPERFLTVDQGTVETRPIKGTRPRHRDAGDDRAAAAALLSSVKERAENLMIVDLLRNDIGRHCKPGSVRAEELFKLESYATVHHLVSVVRGELLPQHSAVDLLLSCMPGGSITGAPKQRAMQIIDELEPEGRQSWCGTLFYLSRHGRLDSNITIRTLFNDGGKLHCWAGGGLVDDSLVDEEYQEQRDKVGAFLRTLEEQCLNGSGSAP